MEKLKIAAMGVEHRHIFRQITGMLDVGCEFVGWWTENDNRISNDLEKKFPDITRVKDKYVLLNDTDIDLVVRAMSMGKLHHAMMGTAAVAIGTAAAIPGTLVNLAAGGGERQEVNFGHPSGTLKVGAAATLVDGNWQVTKASMSRSARVLMEGWVRVPE